MIGDWTWGEPAWLWALALLPALAWWRWTYGRFTVWVVPYSAAWHPGAFVGPRRRRWLSTAATAAGVVLIVLALARPQRVQEQWLTKTRGYDIMLAIDLSSSMSTVDHVRNGERLSRFEAIKPVIRGFIERRPFDRIGVVVFAGRAYTLSPLTFDHAWLARQIDRIRLGLIEDGTALGDGVVLALERLAQPGRERNGRREGGFVVLITDGVNTAGMFTPKEARTLAEKRGVPVYTISAGRDGWIQVPYQNVFGRTAYRSEKAEVDEVELWMMAAGTDGQFFRGYDARTLVRAFNAISGARKIEFESRRRVLTAELFPWLAGPALVLLLGAAMLRRSIR